MLKKFQSFTRKRESIRMASRFRGNNIKRVVLCADDYGQTDAISQAIILLLNKKRLSAVSCLTTASQFLAHAAKIVSYSQIDIGLHLNLTEGRPLTEKMAREGFRPWWRWFHKCFLRRVEKKAVYAELNAQIDRFKEGVGRLPDFIDGHQHVHQFPIIRDILLDIYFKRGLQCYIRSTWDVGVLGKFFQAAYLKKMMIQFCLATSFKIQLFRKKIPHNSSFSGIYDFSVRTPYREQFVQFLSKIKDSGIIMCHPGLHDGNDVITLSREKELAYFQSDEFLDDCKIQNIILSRLQKT